MSVTVYIHTPSGHVFTGRVEDPDTRPLPTHKPRVPAARVIQAGGYLRPFPLDIVSLYEPVAYRRMWGVAAPMLAEDPKSLARALAADLQEGGEANG